MPVAPTSVDSRFFTSSRSVRDSPPDTPAYHGGSLAAARLETDASNMATSGLVNCMSPSYVEPIFLHASCETSLIGIPDPTMIKLIQLRVVALFATLALAFPAAATTYSTDYTDLWWGGTSESGWGINLIQEGEILFATMFVYANDNTAHWYSASALAPVGGSTTNYSGGLTGSPRPWLGNPTLGPDA